MSIQNLIICDSKIIFDILIEIKEKLNCNLSFKSKEELLKLTNIENCLILSDHKILELENQIILKDLPIKISKLIETIHISFLKKNFNIQSEIVVGSYKINLNSRVMSDENKSLNLTEKETFLILYLKNQNKPCSVNNIQEIVWHQSSILETHTVETHIYRLRKKIKDMFNDDKFIISLKDGYLIN